MSDTFTSDNATPNLTIREALEANPRLSSPVLVDRLASLLSASNSRAVMEGLKLAAELAGITTAKQQGPVVAVSPDDLRRLGAALAAVLRDESARSDWQAHPSLGGFLQQLYGRHLATQEALIIGATLNARAPKGHAPLPLSQVPSPAATPTALLSDPAPVSPPLTLPCITCKQAPRRPNQRTCKGCHAEAMREFRRRKRAQVTALAHTPQSRPWPQEYPKESSCEWCGEMFTPARYGQRFCSNICGGKHATAVLEAEQRRRAEGQ